MKKKVMIILMMAILLIGCGSTGGTVAEEKQAESESQIQEDTEKEEHTHAYVEQITTEATCETEGLKTFTCECGDTYTEVIATTGHIFENYVPNNDATYLADGTETAVCSFCELTDTRTVEGSKLEYTYTDVTTTMYAIQSVNVRDLPDTEGNKLGSLTSAQEVTVTGHCNETGWYRIEFEGGIAYVSNSYLQDQKPEQQAAQSAQTTPSEGSTSGNTYTLDGMTLEYGVMYLNVCGHNLTGERALSRSQGPFPYQLGQLIDNGDGTYTVYIIESHGYFLDEQFYIHDTSSTSGVWHALEQQGYSVSYVGGSSWHACVGGYDQGCIKKLLVTR